MRSHAKLTLGVLIAVCACLVVTVSAQKGKPAPEPTYVWSVTLGGASGLDPIFASGDLKRGPTTNVVVQYNTPTDRPAYSRFFVQVGAGDTSKWIGFRDLVGESSTLEPGLNPICQYPDFNADGFAVTDGVYSPSSSQYCGLEFLSGSGPGGHKHPNGTYYSWASLDIRGEFRFDAIEVGQQLPVNSGVAISPAVLPTPCGSTYGGVNGGFSRGEGALLVTRTGPDTWKVEATAPASFYEYGGATVFKRGPRGTVTCTGHDYGRLIVTQPITTVSVWHRQLQ